MGIPDNFSTWTEYFFEHWDDLLGPDDEWRKKITDVSDHAFEEWEAGKDLIESLRAEWKTCDKCGARYDAKRAGCGYCEAERVQADVNSLRALVAEQTERLRETLKAGNWARGEATEAKGRAVVAEQKLREMTKSAEESNRVANDALDAKAEALADLAGEKCRVRDARRERDVLQDAIEALGKIAGEVSITDGDTTCSLAYWARETLRRMEA